LFQNQHTYLHHLSGKKHKKNQKGQEKDKAVPFASVGSVP